MSATEKVIRQLACELWEQAGRPDDRSDEFWFAARYESERREETGEELGAPVRRLATAGNIGKSVARRAGGRGPGAVAPSNRSCRGTGLRARRSARSAPGQIALRRQPSPHLV